MEPQQADMVRQRTLLDEIDERQDRLLDQLSALNAKLEALLGSFAERNGPAPMPLLPPTEAEPASTSV